MGHKVVSVETCTAILMAEKSSPVAGEKGRHRGASPPRPDRPASACEAERRPAENQEAVEDGEIPEILGNEVTPQPKKSKSTDGSSLLGQNLTLTSSIHQLMQVMTPPASAESSGGGG